MIFSLILGICMFATVSGFRMFEQAGSRHQLQREAAAIFAWLQRELEVTNLVGTNIRLVIVEIDRHDVCVP